MPHHEIKRILGHKTDSMFERYRIASAKRLRDIGRLVAAHLEAAGRRGEGPPDGDADGTGGAWRT